MPRQSWLGSKRSVQGRHRERRHYRPNLERLESRCLLAAFRWINPAGGDFAVAANWQDEAGNAGVPGLGDDALILLEAATVTSSGTRTIRNLTSTGTLQITGGTLTAAAANLVGAANLAG